MRNLYRWERLTIFPTFSFNSAKLPWDTRPVKCAEQQPYHLSNMIQAQTNITTPRRRKAAALTEAEVQAMPEDDYMNNVQLAFFKGRLSLLEQQILAKAQGGDEAVAAETAADPVDRASVEEEHWMALSTRARDAAQLTEVRAALGRIEAGEFGYCNETGDPIGIARLLVRPTAVLTAEAQQRQENMARRFRM